MNYYYLIYYKDLKKIIKLLIVYNQYKLFKKTKYLKKKKQFTIYNKDVDNIVDN